VLAADAQWPIALAATLVLLVNSIQWEGTDAEALTVFVMQLFTGYVTFEDELLEPSYKH
jgi:hypothetical protein